MGLFTKIKGWFTRRPSPAAAPVRLEEEFSAKIEEIQTKGAEISETKAPDPAKPPSLRDAFLEELRSIPIRRGPDELPTSHNILDELKKLSPDKKPPQ